MEGISYSDQNNIYINFIFFTGRAKKKEKTKIEEEEMSVSGVNQNIELLMK